jgi:hypothetical protein
MTVKDFKARFIKFFDSLEDETEEEKAARLAKEAEEKKTKDAEEDEDKKKAAEEAAKAAEEAKEKETKDQDDGKLADLEERLKRIEDMLAELLSEESETEDEDPLPLEIKDDAPDDEEKKRLEEEEAAKKAKSEDDAAAEEEAKKKEEEEEEAKKTTDALWPDLISRADILVPGIRLTKPTKDNMAALDEIKVDLLKKAVSGGDKDVLTPLIGDRSFRKMTTDALDITFVAATEVVAAKRNSRIQVKDARGLKTHDFATARTVADINKANKDFYGAKTFVEKG